MKKLIPASLFCLVLQAQQPPPDVPKLTNPFVTPPVNIGVWSVVKGRQDSQKHELLVPPARKLVQGFRAGEITLAGTFEATDTGVCSVPLLEANVAPANDPGIATKLSDNSVPIRQARVPAQSCKK
jgi:hypothetical protein